MTASELRYLITANELNNECGYAKMSAIAKRLNVTKVSASRAVERLIASGYLERDGKKIILTDEGENVIAEYILVVDFIGDKIARHCKTPKEVAFGEAVAAACALGEVSRNAVLSFVKSNGTDNL